jgi:hypothetical protein
VPFFLKKITSVIVPVKFGQNPPLKLKKINILVGKSISDAQVAVIGRITTKGCFLAIAAPTSWHCSWHNLAFHRRQHVGCSLLGKSGDNLGYRY